MSKKPARKAVEQTGEKKRSPLQNVLLMLTLVPVVIGVLLIGAWALDYQVFEGPQTDAIVGIMFLLMGFAGSNAVLRKWRLAGGWGLLMLSNMVVLAWLQLWAQVVAILLGLVGLGFLVVEFYQQYKLVSKN